MADESADWSLVEDDAGNVILITADGRRENLGPHDDVLTRFADFFGDDCVDLPAGFEQPAQGGVAS